MRSYGEVLAFGQARQLMLAMVPVRFGYAMAGLTLVLLVRDRTGSFALAGLGLGIFSLAAGLLAPLRGHLVDTLGQTRPLLVYLPVFSLCFAALAAVDRPVPLLILCAVGGAASPPLLASSRALWRPIVGPDLVRTAYALDAIAMQAAQVLGPVAAAAVVVWAGPGAAVLVIAALVFVGGLLFLSLPASRAWTGDREAAGLMGAVRSEGIRTLLMVSAALGTAAGAITVALPAIAVQENWPLSGGVLLGALAVGSVIGGTLAGSRSTHGPVRGLGRSILVLAVTLLVAAIPAPWPVLALLLVLAGFGLGPSNVYLLELIDRLAPRGSAVTGFAAVVALEGAFVGLGAFLAGQAADADAAHIGLVVAGLSQVVAGLVVLVRRNRLQAPTKPQQAGRNA